ncbi:MAG: stage III sporulation protein AD [Clostridia bacterium]
MEVFKIVGFAIFAVTMVIVLKQQKPEMALMLAIATGIFLILFAMSKMSIIVDMLYNLISKSGINKDFLEIILKVTGIAYIVEFGKNICMDAGQSAIATKLEMAGKVIIITLSLPLISALVNILTGLV